MAWNKKKLRIERLEVSVAYHSAYTYWSLKGVLAEQWAHGPVFGAFNENPAQVTLSPPLEESDRRIAVLYGLKNAGINAEGPKWAPEAPALGEAWLSDVYKVLKPKKTTRARVDLIGLHPISDPDRVSQLIRARFYNDGELSKVVPEHFGSFHSAVEGIASAHDPRISFVMGVVGPVHENQFFAFPDPDRDSRWWLGLRLAYQYADDEGIDNPLEIVRDTVGMARNDFASISSKAFPSIMG